MAELPTWPPPPDTPAPLSAHDQFLSDCVRHSTPKPQLSRLRLMMRLHQETRQDLRYCRTVVNDFCDRHTVLIPDTGIGPWIPSLLSIVNFLAILVMYFGQDYLRKSQNAAVTHLGKLAFRSERIHLDLLVAGVILVNLTCLFIAIAYRQKKARTDAAKAIAKFV